MRGLATADRGGPVGAIDALARALGPRARRDQPLGALTTYRVGGTTALFVTAEGPGDLVAVGRAVADVAGSADVVAVPVLVLGRGSNLLVADRGFEGLVVALASGFAGIDVTGPAVTAGAAVALPVLARRTAAAGLTGLEWAVGVPGSVGGAVRMNAGGHGSDTAATLRGAEVVDLRCGDVVEWSPEQLAFGYRASALSTTDVVTSATFDLLPGDAAEGAATIAEIVRWRRANQPGGSNAGSVFANPPGDSAGRLIDEAGLKGFRIGSAEVSAKHANFIVADEDGTAADVMAVLTEVRRIVAERTGVELVTEVRTIGFDAAPDAEGAGGV